MGGLKAALRPLKQYKRVTIAICVMPKYLRMLYFPVFPTQVMTDC